MPLGQGVPIRHRTKKSGPHEPLRAITGHCGPKLPSVNGKPQRRLRQDNDLSGVQRVHQCGMIHP